MSIVKCNIYDMTFVILKSESMESKSDESEISRQNQNWNGIKIRWKIAGRKSINGRSNQIERIIVYQKSLGKMLSQNQIGIKSRNQDHWIRIMELELMESELCSFQITVGKWNIYICCREITLESERSWIRWNRKPAADHEWTRNPAAAPAEADRMEQHGARCFSRGAAWMERFLSGNRTDGVDQTWMDLWKSVHLWIGKMESDLPTEWSGKSAGSQIDGMNRAGNVVGKMELLEWSIWNRSIWGDPEWNRAVEWNRTMQCDGYGIRIGVRNGAEIMAKKISLSADSFLKSFPMIFISDFLVRKNLFPKWRM